MKHTKQMKRTFLVLWLVLVVGLQQISSRRTKSNERGSVDNEEREDRSHDFKKFETSRSLKNLTDEELEENYLFRTKGEDDSTEESLVSVDSAIDDDDSEPEEQEPPKKKKQHHRRSRKNRFKQTKLKDRNGKHENNENLQRRQKEEMPDESGFTQDGFSYKTSHNHLDDFGRTAISGDISLKPVITRQDQDLIKFYRQFSSNLLRRRYTNKRHSLTYSQFSHGYAASAIGDGAFDYENDDNFITRDLTPDKERSEHFDLTDQSEHYDSMHKESADQSQAPGKDSELAASLLRSIQGNCTNCKRTEVRLVSITGKKLQKAATDGDLSTCTKLDQYSMIETFPSFTKLTLHVIGQLLAHGSVQSTMMMMIPFDSELTIRNKGRGMKLHCQHAGSCTESRCTFVCLCPDDICNFVLVRRTSRYIIPTICEITATNLLGGNHEGE